MDIEGFIKKIITAKRSNDDWMKNHLHFTQNDYPSILSFLYDSKNASYVVGENNQLSVVRKHFRNISAIDFNIYKFLFDELVDFEKDFQEYLTKRIDECRDYADKCETILNKLVDFKEEISSIITFNYTPIFGLDDFTKSQKLPECYHIHGDLKNNVIIGYDSSDIKQNDYDGIMLSKAWQKMNNSLNIYRLPEKTQYII